jgi:hypothetical protein
VPPICVLAGVAVCHDQHLGTTVEPDDGWSRSANRAAAATVRGYNFLRASRATEIEVGSGTSTTDPLPIFSTMMEKE